MGGTHATAEGIALLKCKRQALLMLAEDLSRTPPHGLRRSYAADDATAVDLGAQTADGGEGGGGGSAARKRGRRGEAAGLVGPSFRGEEIVRWLLEHAVWYATAPSDCCVCISFSLHAFFSLPQ